VTNYTIRQAAMSDAAVIAGHRVAMFRDMGEIATETLATELLSSSTTALAALLGQGAYVGWLAIDESDSIIAGAGAHIRPQLPRVSQDGSGIDATAVPLVVNVYTEPAWRGKGVARALMNVLMDWTRAQEFDRVLLHASDAGRPLYVSLGFSPTNEMRWSPRKHGQSEAAEG
jgi:GNAT superfamily N-acetyltransferase